MIRKEVTQMNNKMRKEIEFRMCYFNSGKMIMGQALKSACCGILH